MTVPKDTHLTLWDEAIGAPFGGRGLLTSSATSWRLRAILR
jgi:hypothetical protein